MSLVVPQPILSFLGFAVVSLPFRSPFPTRTLPGVMLNLLPDCGGGVGGACSAFSLYGNQIGDVGAEALARAVHANTSLETLE